MRRTGLFSKSLTGLALLAMTAAPAAPPLYARSVTPQPKIEPVLTDSPVNCSIFSPVAYQAPVVKPQRAVKPQRSVKPRGKVQSELPAAPAPPPPPPPPIMSSPPPPPPASAVDSNAVVVTGTRRAQQHYETAMPVAVVGSDTIARPYPGSPQQEKYDGKPVASIKRVADEPVSTFAVDVDTGSYSNVRRLLNQGQLPPEAAVRTEEMINYFRYDYARPKDRNIPFSVATDVTTSPWNANSRLLRIGLRGYDVDSDQRPRANLVFLVDVSGSMSAPDKLPLVKSTLAALADQLRSDDRVSIVVYSGKVGLLLAPTSNKAYIKQAIDCMASGGSTAGGDALKIAYATARQNYLENGINRIIMATDGDFNVGTSNTDELKKIVAKERESGVNLTMLGYGTGNIRDELMEGIANVGNGNYAYIDSAMEAKKVLGDELSATLYTIAKDVKIQVEFNPSFVSEYRLIGYENRLLAEEDFDNDKIDAGDIGAGHQVTALYEIIPANGKGWLPERRYPANRVVEWQPDFDQEIANVKLRYKLPGSDESRLISQPIAATMLKSAAKPHGDMAFIVAVAAFGQKLRGDKYLGDFSFDDIDRLCADGVNNRNDFWRQEFRQLNQLARSRESS